MFFFQKCLGMRYGQNDVIQGLCIHYEGFINWSYSKNCPFGECDNRAESNYSPEFLKGVWVATECPTGFVSGTCLHVIRNTSM